MESQNIKELNKFIYLLLLYYLYYFSLKPPPTYELPQTKPGPQKIYLQNIFFKKKQCFNKF